MLRSFIRGIASAAFAFSLLLGAGSYLLLDLMARLMDEAHAAQQQEIVADRLSGLRSELERQLTAPFDAVLGVSTFIANMVDAEAYVESHDFQHLLDDWSASVIARSPYVRNIGFSTGSTLRYAFPMEGNEAIIGKDYRDIPDQWPKVSMALRTGEPIVSGPIMLIQGVPGLVSHIPLVTGHHSDQPQTVMGLLSVVLDYPGMLEGVGFRDAARNLELSIRGTDHLMNEGYVFEGPAELFESDAVIQPVKFLGGSWEIAARPVEGWDCQAPYSVALRIASIFLAGAITLAAFFLLSGFRNRLQQARDFAGVLEQEVSRQTAELVAAKEQAEDANRAKDNFLAVVTHELRTPLNAIIGMTQLVAATPLEKKQKSYLDRVLSSAELLLHQINNILGFSKAEFNGEELQVEAFPVARLRERLHDLFDATAEEQGIRFTSSVDAAVPGSIQADYNKLLQVLINLCSNAIKFTREGEVDLRIAGAIDGDSGELRLRFEVRDTGIGISEQAQTYIFEAFRQGDSGKTRQFQGSGLGLHICRRFVEMMDGDLRVDSTPDVGSCFSFEIPMEAAPDDVGDGHVPVATLDVLATRFGGRLQGRRVLLAEDDLLNQTLVVELLELVGVSVIIAENGVIALEMLETHTVDGVLMDVQMPLMDGVTACRHIRNNPRLAHLPVILMTADSLDDSITRWRETGFDSYVAKPIDIKHLYTVLALHLNRAAAARSSDRV